MHTTKSIALQNDLKRVEFTIYSRMLANETFTILYDKTICARVAKLSHWESATKRSDRGMPKIGHKIIDWLRDEHDILYVLDLYQEQFNQSFQSIIKVTRQIDQHNYEQVSDSLESEIEQYASTIQNYLGALMGALDYLASHYSPSDEKYNRRLNLLETRHNEIAQHNKEVSECFDTSTSKIAVEHGLDRAKNFLARILAFLRKIFCCCFGDDQDETPPIAPLRPKMRP